MVDYGGACRVKKADRVTAEVRALEALDLHGLRNEWRKRYERFWSERLDTLEALLRAEDEAAAKKSRK